MIHSRFWWVKIIWFQREVANYKVRQAQLQNIQLVSNVCYQIFENLSA